MYFDVINCEKTTRLRDFAKRFGLTLFSLEELKSLKIVDGTDDATIRNALENKQTDILLNPHQGRPKDSFHSRNSGLNQVLCELARKNRVAIAFTLDRAYDPKELGKIMQNITFCRKFHIPLLFFSLAKTEYELRNPQDLLSFLRVLGMTPGEAKTSLSGLGEILRRKNIKY